MWKATIICLAVLTVISSTPLAEVYGGVPPMINYQGRLTRADGSPLDTTATLTFTIYIDSLGGTALWSESHDGMVIDNGLIQVLLGSGNPIGKSVFNGDKRWLGVQLQGGPLPTELIPLVSVAYAYKSLSADTAAYAVSSPGGSKWTLTGSVLYTNDYWGIARGDAGNILHGDSAHTMTNLGTNSFTGTISQNYGYSTIAGGNQNAARAWNSTVGGGDQNQANSNYSTIAGGQRNQVSDMYGAIAGGFGDTVKAPYGGALSGRRNVAGDAEGDTAAFVGGGSGNQALGQFSAVGAGQGNRAGGDHSTVAGGMANTASGTASTVSGGATHVASGYHATILGGYGNTASAYMSTAGGHYNHAGGSWSAIGGGQFNQALGSHAAILGGNHIKVDGDYSSILGGYGDTITSDADYSYLFGIKSKLTMDSTFMVDMPHVRFGKESGGYEFPTSDGAAGQVLATNGAGKLNWAATSAAGGWTNGGSVVRLSNANDSVGVGTSTPEVKLHVAGPSANGQMGGALFGVRGTHTSTLNTGSLATNVYGAYGWHNTSGNYGALGSATAGVYGNSSSWFAGYFDGKAYVGGRLGIGTSMALNMLDVEGGAAIGVDYSSIYTAPTNGLIVEGKTGIGANNPTGKLHIHAAESWSTPHIVLSEPTFGESRITHGDEGLQFRNYHAWDGKTSFRFANKGDTTLLQMFAEGEVKIPGRASVHKKLHIGNPELMPIQTMDLEYDGTNGNITTLNGDINIKPAGNVGIGTSDPRDKLEINGFMRLDCGIGNAAALRITEGGTQKWAFTYRPWASGKLSFVDDTGPHMIMTLDPVNDRVGINQDNPAYRLDVGGDCHASSFPTSSDERFKKNIRPLEDVLDKISRIHGISFDWNEVYDSLGRSTGRREIGVIAQDVEAVFPELVTKWGDKDYRAVDYGRLTAVLIEAVKDLRAENQSLKERIEALEGKK